MQPKTICMKETTKDILQGIVITLIIILGIVGFYFLFTSGPNVMSNDKIITETKKCNDAGLDATAHIKGWNYRIIGIQCNPKK